MTEFQKFDEGKPELFVASHLFPQLGVMQMEKVLEMGASKYGADNWKECEDFTRYWYAALRHMRAYQEGEEIDAESGQSHLAHVACCCLFILSSWEPYMFEGVK